MSVNVKLGNNTISGIDTVKLKNADNESQYYSFTMGGGLLDKTVTFSVDGATYYIASCKSGKSISMPATPVKSGYVFSGWSSTSGGSVDITFPYSPTADVTLYAVFNTVIQLKASPVGYGNSSPTSIAFSTNANLVSWTPDEVTVGGNIFLKFPTFYRKIVATSDNQITSFIISSWQEDSDFVPYSVFIDENGNTMPYVLIGKYPSSSAVGSNLNSVDATKVTRAIGEARTYARAVGNGYQQWDWQFQKLWQDLICAKMQTININTGSGFDLDSLGISWRQSGTWVDGVATPLNGTKWVFSYKPSAYVDEPSSSTTDYNEANYVFPTGSGVEISKLGYDATHPFFNQPTATVSNSSYNTYYCDAYYYSSGSARPLGSDVGVAGDIFGAFGSYVRDSWSSAYGARLCYRPLTA